MKRILFALVLTMSLLALNSCQKESEDSERLVHDDRILGSWMCVTRINSTWSFDADNVRITQQEGESIVVREYSYKLTKEAKMLFVTLTSKSDGSVGRYGITHFKSDSMTWHQNAPYGATIIVFSKLK